MDIDKLIRIRSNSLKPAKGRILISEPFLGDYYFGRSVVLLAEHNEEGSFGLIMNKPVTSAFNDVVKDFPPFEAPVFIGGPVSADSLFFIHTFGKEIPDSSEILPDLFWGGDLETVREMMIRGKIKPSGIRFYLGYSGWEASQLDEELKRNSWLVSRVSASSLLKTSSADMWQMYVRRMGTDYDLWRSFPVDPQMN